MCLDTVCQQQGVCNRVGSQSEKVLAATVHVVEELGRLNKVSDGPRPIH